MNEETDEQREARINRESLRLMSHHVGNALSDIVKIIEICTVEHDYDKVINEVKIDSFRIARRLYKVLKLYGNKEEFRRIKAQLKWTVDELEKTNLEGA